MIDVERIKDAARGRWVDLLVDLGGFSYEDLDGDHHACPGPQCNGQGKDSFRFTKMNGDGSASCSTCGLKSGDGIGTLMWKLGFSFHEAMKLFENRLGRAANKGNERRRNAVKKAGVKFKN